MFPVRSICEPLEGRRLFSATLTGAFARVIPQTILPATTDHITLRVANTGDALATGKATISLYASTDPVVNADAALLTTSSRLVRLSPRHSAAFMLRFAAPTTLAEGNYFLVARIDAPVNTDGSVTETVAASPQTVSIPQPFVDLTGRIATRPTRLLISGGSRTAGGSAGVLVVNSGNAPARGALDIQMFASTDSTLDSADTPIAAMHFKNVNIRAGGSRLFPVRLNLPGSTPVGNYSLFAVINSANSIAERDLTNNVATARKPLVLANAPTLIDLRHHHHDQNDDGSTTAVDVTIDTEAYDNTSTSDTSDNSSPPPDASVDTTTGPASPPTDSGTSTDSTSSDFGGDFSGDSGGGADF
jgi:hypothetical protein